MLPEANLPWWRSDRPWGFRFSWIDALAFVVAGALTYAGWEYVGAYALVVPFLLAHFFLFCNTFRIGGKRELTWAGLFVVNALIWSWTNALLIHIVAQLALTLQLLIQSVRSPYYNGIGCTRINPDGYRNGAKAEGTFTWRVLQRCGLPPRLIEFLAGRKPSNMD